MYVYYLHLLDSTMDEKENILFKYLTLKRQIFPLTMFYFQFINTCINGRIHISMNKNGVRSNTQWVYSVISQIYIEFES